MSAYIVDRDCIRYLVSAMMSRRIQQGDKFSFWDATSKTRITVSDRDSASKVGQILWLENIRSVQGRYPDDKPGELPGPIGETFIYAHSKDVEVEPVQVLKACACYSYQACESDDWEQTAAHAIIEALKADAIGALPGYEQAAWGAPRQAKARS